MGFGDITAQAQLDYIADQRKRLQEKADLELEAQRLKQDEAESLAGQVAKLREAGGRNTVIDPGVARDAEQIAFLEQQKRDRLTKRMSALDVPIQTAAEREQKALGPLADLAHEDANVRADELKRDPRGRMGRLEDRRDQLLQDITSGGAAPYTRTYTNAPRATSADDTGTMPYEGALEGLRGADVPRAAIRKEFGGTAPDTTLSFTNRPDVAAEQGMRRYDTEGGRHKDIGAPGGDIGRVTGGGGPGKYSDALAALGEEIDVAKRQPFTPQETAGDVAKRLPEYVDRAIADKDPGKTLLELDADVGKGLVNPATAQQIRVEIETARDSSFRKDSGDFDPDVYEAMLGLRKPASDQKDKALAAIQKGAVDNAPQRVEADKNAMVAHALGPQPGAPGTERAPQPPAAPGATPAPGEGQGQGFLASLAEATQGGARGIRGTEPGGPETPPWLAPTAARVGIPLAAGLATSGASIPLQAAALFAGGAGGEGAGEALAGEDVSPRRMGEAGLIDAVLGPLLSKGAEFAPSILKRMRSPIKGVYGPGSGGAPTQVLGGLTEEAGAGKAGMSTLDRVRQAQAEANLTPNPTGGAPWYNPESVPALRGGGDFTLGPGGPVESAARPVRARPMLEGPPGPLEGEVLPPAHGGNVLEGEVVDPREALLRELFTRGPEEGGKQLVPRLGAVTPRDQAALLDELRAALGTRRRGGVPVGARDMAELLAMMQRAGG